jgi:uncharacterized protein YndB with AHSA1/START domain
MTTHTAMRFVPAPPEVVYEALVRPERLVRWLPPQGSTGQVDAFEPRAGGRIRITLRFATAPGKSGEHTDVIEGRFVELVPGERVVQAFSFRSDAPEFAGVMTMRWELVRQDGGTRVTVTAQDVPRGIAREDHEKGMASSLENLAAFVGA